MSKRVWLAWDRKPESSAESYLEPPGISADLRWVSGDNLPALGALAGEFRGGITLAYLDPPFLTGKKHYRVTRGREAETGKILRRETVAFDDRWSGMPEYLDALGPRLEAIHPLLAGDGSIVVHVDSKTSHYVRVLCDEIYGPEAFVSEIIWRYRRWPSKTQNFQRVHDVLLRYVKDPGVKPRFNQLYEPLSASTLATWGTRKQRAVIGISGRRARSSSTAAESPGVPMGDVWDIGIIAPVAKERTGYPTQKPETLLERLIAALSDPGDWILDPYAGSGTTLVVAGRMSRRAIAIDLGVEALDVTQKRCAENGLFISEQEIRCEVCK